MPPAVEGLSLAATLQRQPDKITRPFLQTGTVPAAPPGSRWKWDAEEAQPLPDPWVPPLWYLPGGSLSYATQADWSTTEEHAYWRGLLDRMAVGRTERPNGPIYVAEKHLGDYARR